MEPSTALADLTDLIVARLERDQAELSRKYAASSNDRIGTRHVAIDDLLPEPIVSEVHGGFPIKEAMRRLSSFRESKYALKQLDAVPAVVKNVTFAIQDPRVVAAVERIIGIRKLKPDPTLYAGGISLMAKGDFLNPHIDNSHDLERRHYRRLNLLFYVTPGWRLENGGNLELWDRGVRESAVIPSLFNRLVLMETNRWSWHSVSPVVQDGSRCCVSNYYFTEESPEPDPYFHVTSFSARPEQVFRRLWCRVDNGLRNAVRLVFKRGLGRTDVYQAKP